MVEKRWAHPPHIKAFRRPTSGKNRGMSLTTDIEAAEERDRERGAEVDKRKREREGKRERERERS